MNSLWDIRIFLGLVPKESPCTTWISSPCSFEKYSNVKFCENPPSGCSKQAAPVQRTSHRHPPKFSQAVTSFTIIPFLNRLVFFSVDRCFDSVNSVITLLTKRVFYNYIFIGQNGWRRIKLEERKQKEKYKLYYYHYYCYNASVTHKIYPSVSCVQAAQSISREVDIFRTPFDILKLSVFYRPQLRGK